MPLRPITFNKISDIYAFLAFLEEKEPIAFKKNARDHLFIYTNVVVYTNVDMLASQFLVTDTGETYLAQDIAALSDQEAETITINFIDKKGQKLSVKDAKALLIKKKNHELLLNKPLAEALISANPKQGSLLNIKVPDPKPLGFLPIAYPVITTLENTYEERLLDQWLKSLTDKNQKVFFPKPFESTPLTANDYWPNHALRKLIWLNVYQMQSKKAKMVNNFEKVQPWLQEKVAEKIVRLEPKHQDYYDNLQLYLADLVKIKENLLKQKEDLLKQKELLDKKHQEQLAEYLTALKKYPTLANKNKEELEQLVQENKTRSAAKLNKLDKFKKKMRWSLKMFYAFCAKNMLLFIGALLLCKLLAIAFPVIAIPVIVVGAVIGSIAGSYYFSKLMRQIAENRENTIKKKSGDFEMILNYQKNNRSLLELEDQIKKINALEDRLKFYDKKLETTQKKMKKLESYKTDFSAYLADKAPKKEMLLADVSIQVANDSFSLDQYLLFSSRKSHLIPAPRAATKEVEPILANDLVKQDYSLFNTSQYLFSPQRFHRKQEPSANHNVTFTSKRAS